MKRVAVIGCGSTGLATLGQLSSREGVGEVVGYERQAVVGGEWNYTPNTDYIDGVRPSAIYNSLRLNSDTFCSMIDEFPFTEDIPCWPTHQQMRDYLHDYAKHLNLDKHIKFRVKVEHVSPVDTSDVTPSRWQVKSKDLVTGRTEQEIYDAIVVCTGMFQDPVFPEGIERYRGPCIHSCQYREPAPYRDKTVLVIGSGPSSWDITLEVARVANKVYISSRGATVPMDIPENAQCVSAVNSFREKSVLLEDGVELEIEAIVMCTGYQQNYPYLDPVCHVSIRQEVTYPLYKMVVHPEYPTSLFFNGMVYIDAHNQTVSFTAKVIGNLINGSVVAPSRQLMEKTIEETFRKFEENGQPPRDMLKLGSRQDEYYKELAALGGIQDIPDLPTFKEICRIVENKRFHLLRRHTFVLNDDGSCDVIYETNT